MISVSHSSVNFTEPKAHLFFSQTPSIKPGVWSNSTNAFACRSREDGRGKDMCQRWGPAICPSVAASARALASVVHRRSRALRISAEFFLPPLSSFTLVVPVSHPHIKCPFFSSSGFYGGTHTVFPNIAKKREKS